MSTPENDARPARRRRGFLVWLGRGAAGLVILLFVLVVAGLAYQSLAGARDRRDFPPPGRLVDIGGFKLHLFCTGNVRAGRPTVILESGLASMTPVWYRVQTDISAQTKVCSYDRAGVGWSEPSPQPRDASHIARELRALLDRAGISGPYVVVGHSSGGLYFRAFQRLFPDAVSGMVLIDSTPEGYHRKTPEGRVDHETTTRLFVIAPLLARLGLIRLGPTCRAPALDAFPARQAAEFRALCASSDGWSVYAEEHRFVGDPLPPGRRMTIPLIVLTAGQNIRTLASWKKLQDALADLSSDSRHIVVARASHVSFLLDARDAKETSAAIRAVVDAAASGRPLQPMSGPAR